MSISALGRGEVKWKREVDGWKYANKQHDFRGVGNLIVKLRFIDITFSSF